MASVTIPFAGFYCSEDSFVEVKGRIEVTIPFAGFYCSEKSYVMVKVEWWGHNPVRGILLF